MARLVNKGIIPISLWICMLFHFSGTCQNNLQFHNITAEQGLPGKLLMDMIQDQDGFIWCAFAGSGVARYDGQFFKLYEPQTDNPKSLSYNYAQSLLIDSQLNMWVGTWKGLNLYNIEQDNFTRFFSDKISGETIYAVYEDRLNRVWTGAGGLKQIVKTDTSYFISEYAYINGDTTTIISDKVRGILEDEENNLWIACDNGMNLFNESTQKFLRFPAPQSNMQIQTAMIDQKGQIWLGTFGQGLWQFDHHTGEYFNYWEQVQINTPHNEFAGTIRKIFEDSKGKFWIATDGSGLGLLDPNRHILTMYMHDPLQKESLVHNNVLSLAEDSQGNLWIGTVDGISVLNARTASIKKTRYHPLVKNGLSNNWITDIMEDERKNLWIGTEGGINYLETATGRFTHFQHQPGKPGLTSNKVASILKDHAGWIWCGHWLTGVTKFHPDSKQFIQYAPDNPRASFLSNYNVKKIHQDQNEDYWFLNDAGVDFLDHRTKEFHHFDFPFARDLVDDREGNLWVVGTNGFALIDKTKFQLLIISERGIFSLLQDREGFIWLATYEDGVVKYNPENGEETTYNQINGLGPACYGILEVNNGHLWVTSSGGIFNFDPKTGDTRKILTVVGSDNPKFRPYLKSHDGYIHIGTINGIISLHPDSIPDYPMPPAPVFTEFLLFNKEAAIGENTGLKTSISYTKEISLNHLQNVFTVNFVSPYFEEPSSIKYAFKLEGFDRDWRDVGNQKSATYTNLDAGSYEFRVKASNQNNIWNPQEATLDITILPPPWRTWWAYSIYATISLILIYFVYKQILRREHLRTRMQLDQLELEKVKEMDQVKTQFFANVSHEFRTPLTLILGPLKQIYEGNFKGDLHKTTGVMIRNSKRLLYLVNQLLDFTKLEAGGAKLEVSVGDMVEFLRTMFATFESTAKSRGIRYIFQSEISSLPVYFNYEKLEKVIINLLSNAFKFTPDGGRINLEMRKIESYPEADRREGQVEIRIVDNGQGIPPDKLPHIFERFYQADASFTRVQEGTGIGLTLAKELVQLHHGNILAHNNSFKGTTFVVTLPLGRSHLQDHEIVSRQRHTHNNIDYQDHLPVVSEFEDLLMPVNGEGNPRVLLIDDNKDMLLYLQEILNGSFQITSMTNGFDGLESAFDQIPDLIISDVMMPKMDGHQVCLKLKSDERTSHIPVILLTARAGEEAKLEGLETGADDYITKPFSPIELRARVQNLIELRQKLREKFGKNLWLAPNEVPVTSIDQRFLQRAYDILEIHRSDPDFNSDVYAKEVGMSRSQLHRKLKALTNYSTGEFIRTYRLNYAKELITKNFGDIAQISYECGFSSPSYFTDCFKKQFGAVPTEFVKGKF